MLSIDDILRLDALNWNSQTQGTLGRDSFVRNKGQ